MNNIIRDFGIKAYFKAINKIDAAKKAINNENGDFYVSEGVKVIIAVILGSLLITAMVALFNDNILRGIKEKITALFNSYTSGTLTPPSGTTT